MATIAPKVAPRHASLLQLRAGLESLAESEGASEQLNLAVVVAQSPASLIQFLGREQVGPVSV